MRIIDKRKKHHYVIFFIKLNQLPSLSLSSQIYQHLAYLPWYTIIRYSPLPQLDVFQHMSQAIILSFHTSLLSLVLELLLLHLEIECGIQQLYCCLVYLQLLLHKNMYLLVWTCSIAIQEVRMLYDKLRYFHFHISISHLPPKVHSIHIQLVWKLLLVHLYNPFFQFVPQKVSLIKVVPLLLQLE